MWGWCEEKSGRPGTRITQAQSPRACDPPTPPAPTGFASQVLTVAPGEAGGMDTPHLGSEAPCVICSDSSEDVVLWGQACLHAGAPRASPESCSAALRMGWQTLSGEAKCRSPEPDSGPFSFPAPSSCLVLSGEAQRSRSCPEGWVPCPFPPAGPAPPISQGRVLHPLLGKGLRCRVGRSDGPGGSLFLNPAWPGPVLRLLLMSPFSKPPSLVYQALDPLLRA